jgi:hypothetical protein
VDNSYTEASVGLTCFKEFYFILLLLFFFLETFQSDRGCSIAIVDDGSIRRWVGLTCCKPPTLDFSRIAWK